MGNVFTESYKIVYEDPMYIGIAGTRSGYIGSNKKLPTDNYIPCKEPSCYKCLYPKYKHWACKGYCYPSTSDEFVMCIHYDGTIPTIKSIKNDIIKTIDSIVKQQ